MNKKTNRIRIAMAGWAFLISSAMLISCDTLESDQRPAETAELSDDPIYVNPSSSGIIDLRSLVNANMDVVLQVSSQPKHGSLTPLGSDLLLYSKNEGVSSASDGFLISIFSRENAFLKKDSVKIIVAPDSTHMPCNGLTAITDYVTWIEDGVNTYVDIAVLENDWFCGIDSTLIEVTLPATPNVNFPRYGTAEVISDNRIRYSPNASFDGEDMLIYEIAYKSTPGKRSFGVVYIAEPPPCVGQAFDDTFVFSADSLAADTVSRTIYLNVLMNDSICSYPVKRIVTPPQFGSVLHADAGAYFYTLPETASAGYIDQFVYSVCEAEEQCTQAVVTIKLE